MTAISTPPRRRGLGLVSLLDAQAAPCAVDLSDNTSAWGMPPAAREAMSRALDLARYPSPYGAPLKSALAEYTGLPSRLIATGCGSDDVLDAAMRAFAEPGDRVAFTAPTFGMIPDFARINGLVPVAAHFDDLPSAGRIVYVCSPNNPTGELVSRERIEWLLDACRDDQVVIVDEAYFEFAGQSVIDLVTRSDRLLVTRTLSKAFGLAGLRVGYAAGAAPLIAELEKSRGPYKVSAVAEQVAVAAVTEGREWVIDRVADALRVRERLFAALRERGLDPMPSAANFVLVPLPNASEIARRMRERGVALRAFPDLSAVRITVAPWDTIAVALAALDAARAECE